MKSSAVDTSKTQNNRTKFLGFKSHIAPGVTLTVPNSQTLVNNGTITNNGTINNNGTIENSGTIYNNSIINGAVSGTPPIERRTLTGVRPAAGQNAIVGDFNITVTRQGITQTLAVSVNLTPLAAGQHNVIVTTQGSGTAK